MRGSSSESPRLRSISHVAIALLLCTDPVNAQSPDDYVVREELRVGSVDGDDALEFFASLLIDPEGRIWLPQSGSGRLEVFERDGSRVMRVGREGEG